MGGNNKDQDCSQDEKGGRCGFSERMSEDAAEHAVKKVFAILGVNIDNPESVEEFREDLRFGKKMRKAANHGTLAFVSVVVVAFAYASWAGVISYINKIGP